MLSKDSVESLLQMLVNTPETEKGSVLYSLVKALRETCGLFKKSSPEYQQAAKRVQEILDSILSETIQAEEEWEDEFSESSSQEEKPIVQEKSVAASDKFSISENFFEEDDAEEIELTSSQPHPVVPTPPPPPPASNTFVRTGGKTIIVRPENRTPTYKNAIEEAPSAPPPVETPLNKLLNGWNSSVGNWLKFPQAEFSNSTSIVKLVQSISAARNNILSNNFDDQSTILAKLDRLWESLVQLFQENRYRVVPNNFNNLSNPQGRLIYACRSRVTTPETELVCPAIWQNDNLLKDSIWVLSYSPDGDFPSTASRSNLPSHWRGIFGELELLLEQIKIQTYTWAAVEGINKNKPEVMDETRDNLAEELSRRTEVLESTIQKDSDNLYHVASDYWRIEEFFWSLFHEDDRPVGCSVFDRLRNRLQSWRPALRRLLKFQVRDFACGSDSLASVNKYIGNIIISSKANTGPGMVIRELRPAIMVPVQGSNRLLKGRVIAT